GNVIGHSISRMLFGPPTIHIEQSPTADEKDGQALQSNNSNSTEHCRALFEDLQSCIESQNGACTSLMDLYKSKCISNTKNNLNMQLHGDKFE
ncbi:MAG: hypothetical protein MHPSP_004585, partial [Paramarteilia canceri]